RHLTGSVQHHVEDKLESAANGDIFHLAPHRVIYVTENFVDTRPGDQVRSAGGEGAGDSRLHHLRSARPTGVHVRDDVADRDADLRFEVLAAHLNGDAQRGGAEIDEVTRLLREIAHRHSPEDRLADPGDQLVA